jgi:hypothetical protein
MKARFNNRYRARDAFDNCYTSICNSHTSAKPQAKQRRIKVKFDVPKNNFVPHSAGMFTGIITDVTDQGERESNFEGKTKLVHKISFDITSDTAIMDGGKPFVHREWCTLSSDDRSKLVKCRQDLLGRPLTEAEKESFDADVEMIGRRVNYVIEHTFKNGKTYANIATWSLQKGAAPGSSLTPARGEGPSSGSGVRATDTAETDLSPVQDDLPF